MISGQPTYIASPLESHYQRKVANQLGDFRGDSLNALIESCLNSKQILDVGCGSGAGLIYFSKRGYQISGIDASSRMIEMAKTSLQAEGLDPDIAKVQEVSGLPVNHYPIIISCDVLEHVENDAQMAAEIADRLTPGGRFVITVPAMPSLFGPKDEAVGHYRRYTASELQALLERAGLQVKTIRYWNFIGILPTWFAVKVLNRQVDETFRYDTSLRSRIIQKLLATWFDVVERHIPFPRGLSLVAIAEKR